MMYAITKKAALETLEKIGGHKYLILWIETDQCDTAFEIIKTLESYGVTIE